MCISSFNTGYILTQNVLNLTVPYFADNACLVQDDANSPNGTLKIMSKFREIYSYYTMVLKITFLFSSNPITKFLFFHEGKKSSSKCALKIYKESTKDII